MFAKSAATPLRSRTARARLPPGRHTLDLGEVALVYRRNPSGTGGQWSARLYLGDRRYQSIGIGRADDVRDGDGITFDAAVAAAIEAAQARALDAEITVRNAVEAYLRDHPNGRRSGLHKHILDDDPIADVPLAALDHGALAAWRGRREGVSQSTIRRLTNDLRAALNAAGKAHRGSLPVDFRVMVRDATSGMGGDRHARRLVLSEDQVRLIVSTAAEVEQDFGNLVLVLAATGARYSQAARLTVGDLVLGNRPLLMMPPSEKGRGAGSKPQHIAVPIDPSVAGRLAAVAARRPRGAPLLERDQMERVPGKATEWTRTGRRAWGPTSDQTPFWTETKRRLAADLPPETTLYALRHSSIVRQLRRGLPTALVARLHDTSVTVIEKHYGAFIADALADLARAGALAL